MGPAPAATPSQRGAFAHRGFALYWAARFLNNFATQIVSTAVGWQVYDLTRNPFDLGLVGLFQFAPALLLVLVAAGALGYTQWWIPLEKAQQRAQVTYEHCVEEVQVYLGKHSYAGRLAQCTQFLNG